MQALVEVVLPVFVILGFGYVAVWRGWFSDAGVSALMVYTQTFAVPCLLFRAIADLDLAAAFDLRLLAPFYIGALVCFLLGLVAARRVFGRPWEDSVAIGFCCLFSNSVLLGLPITEQAYGPDALTGNFAIIALHAPVCYAIGLTAMEIVRAGGAGIRSAVRSILHAVFRNALVLGILAGFAVNLSGLEVPLSMTHAVDLMARSALPAALFGLGGVLYRYRPEGDAATIAFVCTVSLIVHPGITYGLAKLTGVGLDGLRSVVLTSAMAPGVNTYIFANLYGVAKRVAASSVLVATAASVVTVWAWLAILP
jgi:malonate transporter and related proteins